MVSVRLSRFVARSACLAALVSLSLTALSAQTPPGTPDIGKAYVAPRAGDDYERREVMIPMRDGVKLFTVIVVPKGASRAPMIMTRTPYNAGRRAARNASPHMLADAAAGRRSVRRRRLHPRLPGRARQVRLGRRLRDHPAAARAAEPDADRSLDRRLRHHRLAGEERARVERPRRHDGQFLRGLHRGDGAREPAPGAESRGADEPDGRRLDGRRLVPLRRVSPAQPRLHRRPDVGARRRRGHAARRIRRLRDVPAGRIGRRVREGARPRSVRRAGGS